MRGMLIAPMLALACSGGGGNTTREDVVTIHPEADPIAPAGACEVTTYREAAAGASHVEVCTDLPLASLPPTGGDHFGRWAQWGTYDAPIPWGFLIHSLEHGGVVIAYDCPEGCDDVVAELETIVAEREDPACRDYDVRARLILAPMPELDAPIAVLAWEHAYVATCFDPSSLRAFIDAHYARAPEDLCVPGVDLSAEGWCP